MVCVGVSAYVVVCGSGGRIPLLKKEEIVLLPSMPHVKIPLPSPPRSQISFGLSHLLPRKGQSPLEHGY